MPGISGPPIPAGGSADYDFPLRFGGTFWMHSHEGLQEQLMMSAPLIIHDERDRADQQEVVVMLADFSFTPPEEIYAVAREYATRAKGLAGFIMGTAVIPFGTPTEHVLAVKQACLDAAK